MAMPMLALATLARPVALNDVEALVSLARELAGVTTLAGLRDAIAGPLRPLLPSRDVSVLRAAHGNWEAVVGPQDGPDRIHQYSWTPLGGDGKTVGMLGIGAPIVGGQTGKYAECATTMLAVAAQNLIAIENLRQASARDGLTGCFTRAHAMEVLEGNMRRAARTGFPVAILMIDLDGFKSINDRYGHMPGDAVLSTAADQLHRMLRQSDVRCRLGGDEFLVILPDTPIDDAIRVAESVRHAIEALVIQSARGPIAVTASIGVAVSGGGMPAIDVPAFIDRADVALYRAKEAGRNTVEACTASTRRTKSSLRLATTRTA
jgi:diguanylate cyclase (GGDEF)-like protein